VVLHWPPKQLPIQDEKFKQNLPARAKKAEKFAATSDSPEKVQLAAMVLYWYLGRVHPRGDSQAP
jgi:hypothetical protein